MPIQWQADTFSRVERSIAAVLMPAQVVIAGRSRAFAYLFGFATFSVAPDGFLGAATNQRELLGLVGEAKGELFVVMHDDMIERYGSALIEEIRQVKADAGVIVLACLEATIVTACSGGLAADAFIAEQNIGKGCLIPAIQAIRAGQTPHVDPLLHTIYSQDIRGRRDVKPREREILALVAAGLTNKQIAAELFIAETTTRDYVSELMQRFEAGNRAALAAVAVERGYGRAPVHNPASDPVIGDPVIGDPSA